jgi:hypothetical protein
MAFNSVATVADWNQNNTVNGLAGFNNEYHLALSGFVILLEEILFVPE